MSEWIETNLPWYYYTFDEIRRDPVKRIEENKQKSFTGRGLNVPGTLIELRWTKY